MSLQKYSEDITVVIPTLGDAVVLDTIRWLNKGTIVPAKILLCVPEHCNLDVSDFSNVEVLNTGVKGQVAQRAAGFRVSNTPFTLQLDDDVLVRPNCLELLMACIAEKQSAVIAPALINKLTGKSLYQLDPPGFWGKIYYWILNGKAGYQQGVITKAGTCFGVDAEQEHETSIVTSDWIPGGFLLNRTSNLVLESYYPFTGKAYAEDLMLSHKLKEKGVEMYICIEAKADVDLQPSAASLDVNGFLKFIRADYKARSYYMYLAGRKRWRMHLYYLIQVLFYCGMRTRLFFKGGDF